MRDVGCLFTRELKEVRVEQLLGTETSGSTWRPYWTEQILAGVGARYRGLDMEPWRPAAVGG